jgi:hypothetical protein
VPDGHAIFIKARNGNDDDMYIGQSKSDAEGDATRIVVQPGHQVPPLPITNTDQIWVDADASADKLEVSLARNDND